MKRVAEEKQNLITLAQKKNERDICTVYTFSVAKDRTLCIIQKSSFSFRKGEIFLTFQAQHEFMVPYFGRS